MPQKGWSLEHLALAAVDSGAWDYNVETGQITWSSRIAELYGMPLDQADGTLEGFLARVHPEDRARVLSEIDRAVKHGPDDLRIVHRVANVEPGRWIDWHGRIYRNSEGCATRMVGVARDCTERRRAEEDEQEHLRLMQAALDASVYALVVLEPNGTITFCNQLAAMLLGLTPSAVRGRSYDAPQWKHTDLDGGPWPEERQPFVRIMTTGEPVFGVEHAIERPDGTRVALRINGQPLKDDRGEIRLLVFSFEDITERRAMEASVRESQKMEAIGRLAGGVAHDFNNLLTVISANTELILNGVQAGAPISKDLNEILKATQRGASLTQQLLAFSRKQVVTPVVLDLDELLNNATRMLRRLIPESVELVFVANPAAARVLIDPGQAEQVLMNLAVNARDAMPAGGRLEFRTDLVTLDESHSSQTFNAPPGTYVCLAVSDTGTGIPDEVLPHVFEPFYTTKDVGRGTGLGLAIVYGIVRQNGGFVTVASTVGEGTTFQVYLPLTHGTPRPEADQLEGTLHGKGECVLIVEDEPAVLSVAQRLLDSEGFRVVTAGLPEDAVQLVRNGLQPQLLVTDMVMPGINGRALYEELKHLVPGLKVVFVSGHAHDVVLSTGMPEQGVAFVQKPYSLSRLLQAVRQTLDHSPA